MIRLVPIVERLRAGGFPVVEGVLEFAGLQEAPRAPVALYVVPQSERAQPNRTTGVTDQKVAHQIAVVLVLKIAQRVPGAISDELALQAEKISRLLVGWKHPDAAGRWEYVGGDLTAADGRGVAWSLGFTAPYHLRSQAQ